MDNRYISMEDFAKNYLFHAKMKAQAELNQIFREIKKYDADDIVNIETYTKADVEAMLEELKTEIILQVIDEPTENGTIAEMASFNSGIVGSYDLIQQKINALRGEQE